MSKITYEMRKEVYEFIDQSDGKVSGRELRTEFMTGDVSKVHTRYQNDQSVHEERLLLCSLGALLALNAIKSVGYREYKTRPVEELKVSRELLFPEEKEDD